MIVQKPLGKNITLMEENLVIAFSSYIHAHVTVPAVPWIQYSLTFGNSGGIPVQHNTIQQKLEKGYTIKYITTVTWLHKDVCVNCCKSPRDNVLMDSARLNIPGNIQLAM